MMGRGSESVSVSSSKERDSAIWKRSSSMLSFGWDEKRLERGNEGGVKWRCGEERE